MKNKKLYLIIAAILSAAILAGCAYGQPINDPAFANGENGIPVGDFGNEYLSREEIKDIVFTHAGVLESDVYDFELELDRDFSGVKFEVDFKCAGHEYNYDVDPYDGTIMWFEKEFD